MSARIASHRNRFPSPQRERCGDASLLIKLLKSWYGSRCRARENAFILSFVGERETTLLSSSKTMTIVTIFCNPQEITVSLS